MKIRKPYRMPPEKQHQLDYLITLEWWNLGFRASIVLVLGLVLGSSQAMKAAWMADNKQSNSVEASISKAKAGRVGNQITLRCVELAGSVGYTEDELLEKWARDSKILDIFEGTQQIQQLVVARRLLNLTSAQLK